jgi:uroporphyrinogen-III synthase
MPLPLARSRFVVTRPSAERGSLAEALRAEGAEVLEFPAQELVASGDAPPAGPFDLAIFTSPAAVEFGRERLRGILPARLAAPGQGTARHLRQVGLGVALAPASGAGLAALLDTPELAERLPGQRVLVVAGRPLKRHSLEQLEARGARPVGFCAYERCPARDPEPLSGWLARRQADAIMVSSVSAVQALTALPGMAWGDTAWIVSSARVGAAVEARGGSVGAVAASAETGDMVRAALAWRSK